jgi:hypothetical protein
VRLICAVAGQEVAVNETLLALLCSIAVYGVSSLALPRPEIDASGDVAEISTELDDSDVSEERSDTGSSTAEIG